MLRLAIAWWIAGSAPAVNPYREPARAILERRCGDCHRADSPLAQPKALAVFTLNELEWSARMTDQQLGDALDRLTGGPIDEADASTFTAFVAAERQSRARQTR